MPIYSNHEVLAVDFLRLVNSSIGADVRLIIGEEQVVMHAHSLILQARSSYFARALNSDWKEGNQGVIYKPNVAPAVFERILEYIYGGRLMIDDEMVMDLIKAADELCMEDLLHGCELHALSIICRNNVLDMVQLASRHNLHQLKTECLDFIASNIDYLKKGKAILTQDADVLKEILLMDQVDMDELEIWKIAVRWAYYQRGLDWEHCPLLEFPRGSGRVIVRTTKDEATENQYQDEDDDSDESDDQFDDARVPAQKEIDEDRFRPHSQSVFQVATSNNEVVMSATVHEDLCKQILPLLPAIRFMRIPSIDFLRLIEGTGLLPVRLCNKIYRYHSVPSMADPYQISLRRRMAFSNILTKEHKEIVINWLQMTQHSPQSPTTDHNSGPSRRSMTYSGSPPNLNISTIGSPPSSSYYIPGTGPLNFPPAYSPITSAPSSPPYLGRVSSGSSSSHRSTITGSSPVSQRPQHTTFLNHVPPPKLILQYRATRDGFDAASFHRACDQRGPTLTVVRADNGTIFGGYNSSSWSSHPTGVYSTSRVNFLFTLKDREHPLRENAIFSIKGDGNAATYNKADYGPTFGAGYDLYLSTNCNLNCQSSSSLPLSYNGQGASPAALAGSCYFRVQEYEVFLVQHSMSVSN
ncbi:hypothetical protein BGZ80_001487 [Entomortierella chlamydospora]|uniref:Uncharacterized protein n=1 Tax=Entomortierella chlamydospora TaxID=101097 RepID=A0A9P6T3H9_9FUNG|nr:hypothetical protein BGZ80_001487 [Entomortierella chlamydospora]